MKPRNGRPPPTPWWSRRSLINFRQLSKFPPPLFPPPPRSALRSAVLHWLFIFFVAPPNHPLGWWVVVALGGRGRVFISSFPPYRVWFDSIATRGGVRWGGGGLLSGRWWWWWWSISAGTTLMKRRVRRCLDSIAFSFFSISSLLTGYQIRPTRVGYTRFYQVLLAYDGLH